MDEIKRMGGRQTNADKARTRKAEGVSVSLSDEVIPHHHLIKGPPSS